MDTVFKRLGAFGLAAAICTCIVLWGQGLWQPLVVANLKFHPEIPWSPMVMAVLLAGLLLYLSGRGWPHSTSETRRRLLRWNPMPLSTFTLAVLAGGLAVGAFSGVWIAVSDLVHIPAGVQPDVAGAPAPTLTAILIMSAMAAPLSEEAAFRGYAQGILERAWGSPMAAILGSTALFAAVHILQGPDPVKLSLYFGAGLIFAAIAYLTNSLYPVMVVHAVGDILGFTVFWPHDQRPHAMGFADPSLAPALAAIAIFTPLAFLAFVRLGLAARPLRDSRLLRASADKAEAQNGDPCRLVL